MQKENAPIYENTFVICAMLVIFWPIGLFLMYKYADWSKTIKIAVTAAVLILTVSSIIFDI